MNNSYYWNSKKWEVNQSGEGTPIHPMVAVFAALTLGGLFVVFLPFIGLYLFAKHMTQKSIEMVKPLFHNSVAPIAVPGEAYLMGSRTEGVSESKAAKDTLEELSKEIQNLRK